MIDSAYLAPSAILDFHEPQVEQCAKALACGRTTRNDIIARIFEFVRDEIRHCNDHALPIVNCRASDVLAARASLCYGKSHLLAALLRANGIATGFCYQRLSINGHGAPYCLHGLNAVYLAEHGWYRLDARGNKSGVDAKFSPPDEALAFSPSEFGECDLPEVWSEPLPLVVSALHPLRDFAELMANLPDVVGAPASVQK